MRVGATRSRLSADGELSAASGFHANEQHVQSVALSLHHFVRNRRLADEVQILLEAELGWA